VNISLYIGGAALLLALLTLLIQEGRALQQRGLAYPWREVWVSIAVAAGRRVLLTVLFGGINLAALNLFYQQRWFTLSLRNEAGVLWWRVLLSFWQWSFSTTGSTAACTRYVGGGPIILFTTRPIGLCCWWLNVWAGLPR